MDRTTPAAPPLGTRALLGIREFRLLWLAQVISDFGDSLTNLALLIFVNQVTGSTAVSAPTAARLGYGRWWRRTVVPPAPVLIVASVTRERIR